MATGAAARAQVTSRLALAQLLAYDDPARVRDSIREHLAIVEALRRTDPWRRGRVRTWPVSASASSACSGAGEEDHDGRAE
jgi:hypothetical protein